MEVNTDTALKDKIGLLYWLHDAKHDDIYSQGYVGITMVGFEHRFKQHMARAKKGGYPRKFCEGLLSDTLLTEVILYGTEQHIKKMEVHFRPDSYIGWNRAIGGGGGVIKHGLTATPIKSCYYNMHTCASKSGTTISSAWSGKGGLIRFAVDMLPIPEGLELARVDPKLPWSKDNCKWLTRSDLLRKMGDVLWNGKTYSYTGLAEIAGESPNTLQYRLYRGWTVEEALNLVPRKKRVVKDFNGDLVPYSGKLTDDEVAEMIDLRSNGATTTAIGEAFDIDSGQVSRLCSRFKVQNV